MNIIYAYLLVGIGVILEGELALLSASIAAQRGILNIILVAITAFLFTLVTDWFFFFIGRFMGTKILNRFQVLRKRIHKPNLWIRENPRLIMILYRYLYGFRIVTLLILGMSKVPIHRFMFYSFIAVLIWTIIFGLLGFFMGDIISKFIIQFEHLAGFIIVGIFSAALMLIIIRNVVRKAL
jgi:membrane protein DedA with SNARE-associated domain